MNQLAPIRGLPVVLEEQTPRLRSGELQVLRPFLRPYRTAALGAVILLLATTGLRLVAPIFFQRAIDRGIVASNSRSMLVFGASFLGAAALSFFTLRYSALLMGHVGQHTLRDLRERAFAHLAGLSLGFFERERSGRLVSRVTSDAEAVEKLVTEELIRILAEITFLVGASIVLFFMDLRLALAAFAVVPGIVIATTVFRRKARAYYHDLRERVATVLSFFQETLRGVHVVRAFARERASADRFEEVNDAWGDAKVGTLRLGAQYFSAIELLSSIGTAIVLAYGGMRVMDGSLSVGKLFAFVVYLGLFFDPLHHLSERYTTFQSAVAGIARIAQLLEVRPGVTDHVDRVSPFEIKGHIRFEDVSFRYHRAAPLALIDVNLDIPAGQTLALVGPTGAGKSTIVKLLARFYDVTDGSLEIDGVDIRKIPLETLRTSVALVPQEGFLFGGTIYDNIRFGDPTATDEEIESTCAQLGIDRFILSLPEGYSTQVRERGARLAAGEKQLIALARALISDPKLILLDEATSSLDSATESRVERAFSRALAGRTCVVIAHRLSTVRHAQRIAVVEHGRIVESGSHQELLQKEGRYASLYGAWLSGTARDGARSDATKSS